MLLSNLIKPIMRKKAFAKYLKEKNLRSEYIKLMKTNTRLMPCRNNTSKNDCGIFFFMSDMKAHRGDGP